VNSMFHASYFGRHQLGSYAYEPMLGQSMADIPGLQSGIEALLAQLPPQLLGTYSAQYQTCKTQVSDSSIGTQLVGLKCLYDLYTTLDNIVKHGVPGQPIVPVKPASDITIPVLVGIAGLGVMIYAVTRIL
jgi:hypothetical protein